MLLAALCVAVALPVVALVLLWRRPRLLLGAFLVSLIDDAARSLARRQGAVS